MSDLATLTAELALFRTARNAILAGAQSYTINGRAVTRGDLKEINSEIESLESRIARASRSGRLIKSPIFGA